MSAARHALRLLVILAGFGVGFGAAALLTGAAFDDPATPRCPQCGSRRHAHPVAYTPGPPDQLLTATADRRYLGLWEPRQDGPTWYCTRCSHGWGSRLHQP